MLPSRKTKRDFYSAGAGDCIFAPVRKRRRSVSSSPISSAPETKAGSDLLDSIPEDLVVSILRRLASTSRSPADFINVLMTCKRLNSLATSPLVLSRLSRKAFAVKAQNWSEAAHRFLKRCVDAGNLEACYTLGMIRFYCLQNRRNGASLMAKAAIRSHAPSLYSLAVIQFNGSGGSKNDKDLRAGVALCARAAFLGHVDAQRELGHCLQDGYANARELAAVLSSGIKAHRSCPLLSDFGCNVPAPETHPANKFLADWFAVRGGVSLGDGLRLCSHGGCGRPETRKHEFRRCSVCGVVNYCSRACQALDWKLRHKVNCAPMEQDAAYDGEGNVQIDGDHVLVVPMS
ncbi:BnaA02g13080D [Brassica napus]|uniref:BnaA02g13080D protein n=1 Tax=Brassica napus TaxID=3708 RepID=A0A078FE44_BRANA|nr:BnaA02g13080D [Brassica napus]